MLPAGPLREPVSRIKDVLFVAVNGDLRSEPGDELSSHRHCYGMRMKATSLYTPVYDKHYSTDHFKGQRVHACAALANPERFFETLEALGMLPIKHAFKDHHAYRVVDFKFEDNLPVVMTAKDGVKWLELAEQGHKIAANVWILETRLHVDEEFEQAMFTKLGLPYL